MWPDPSADGDKNLRVLIVGTDPVLEEEFRSALSRIPDRKGTVHSVDTYRDALEAARRRQPNLILIEIDRATSEITTLSRDLQGLVPDAAIAAAFLPDRMDHGQSEGATLIELLRAHVRDFLRRPLAATELRGVIDRLFTRRSGAATAHGRVAAFLSNKGGIGKSTLAVNVACGLALRHPDEVLLIDTSLQIGTCAMMLDLKPTTSIVDAIHERDRLDKTLLRHLTLRHGSGLRLLAAPADALEASEVNDEAIARIVNMARQSFEYVIIDTFPILDSVLMTILDVADLDFVVVQGMAPAVAATARLLPVLEGLGVPQSRQRLVLNYNYKPFLGNLQPIDIADRLQRTLDYVVPYDRRVLTSMNTGSPHILHSRRWERFGRSINAIVDALDSWNVTAPTEAPARAPMERRLKVAGQEEGL
jgi:pilus assembly protein CpaE